MKITVIGIAGGSGSGKSTFTNRIKEAFPEQVAVLYHDNYYRDHPELTLEERQEINYDHPDSLETEILVEQLRQLKAGQTVVTPVYNFTTHSRSKKTCIVEARPIILVEGILTFQDPELLSLFDIKIFVEADADERIIRRIIRDVNERGRDLAGISRQYLNTVKPMHTAFVEPTKADADIILNGGKNDVAFDIVRCKIKALLEE